MRDDSSDRLLHDAQLVAILRRLTPDDPRRRDLELLLEEVLVGALGRLAAVSEKLSRDDLHLVANVAAAEFVDHTLLRGQWQVAEGQTIADALLARGLEVVAELHSRQGPGGENFARVGRLTVELPDRSRLQAISELVDDTEPAALAVVLLLCRGHAGAEVARSLDVDEDLLAVIAARFWGRFDRAVEADEPGPSECDVSH